MQFGGRQVLWDTRKTTSQMEHREARKKIYRSTIFFILNPQVRVEDLWAKDLFDFQYLHKVVKRSLKSANLFVYFQTVKQFFILNFLLHFRSFGFIFCLARTSKSVN